MDWSSDERMDLARPLLRQNDCRYGVLTQSFFSFRQRKDGITDATSTAVAMSNLSDAAIVRDVHRRTRLSSDSQSGTWLKAPL